MSVEWTWFDHLKGVAVEWVDRQGYVLSRGNTLYEATSLQAPLSLKRLGAFRGIGVASRIRPLQRLLRQIFYNVVRLPGGDLFLTFGKRVGLLRQGRFLEVDGFARPCRFLRGSCAVSPAGDVFMGEYVSNPSRESVRIYRLPLGATSVEPVYEFAPGTVRHVHGIFYDATDDSFWCSTGDVGEECRILRTHDHFATFETVGAGDETWRAVSLVLTQDSVFYGMDAELEQNYLFRLDRGSGDRERLAAVDGPVYYSRSCGKAHLFGVTAEGCPSQQENAASLWCVCEGDGPRRLVTVPTDGYPVQFMFGSLHFSLGPGPEGHGSTIYCYFHGLRGVDQQTIEIVER